jgi:hypothetical protein
VCTGPSRTPCIACCRYAAPPAWIATAAPANAKPPPLPVTATAPCLGDLEKLTTPRGTQEELPGMAGRRVLELGAGTGALGIAVAALGGDVVLTDLPDVVPLTRKNVERNAASFSGRGSAHVVCAPTLPSVVMVSKTKQLKRRHGDSKRESLCPFWNPAVPCEGSPFRDSAHIIQRAHNESWTRRTFTTASLTHDLVCTDDLHADGLRVGLVGGLRWRIGGASGARS